MAKAIKTSESTFRVIADSPFEVDAKKNVRMVDSKRPIFPIVDRIFVKGRVANVTAIVRELFPVEARDAEAEAADMLFKEAMVEKIFALHNQGLSTRKIATAIGKPNDHRFPARVLNGQRWSEVRKDIPRIVTE